MSRRPHHAGLALATFLIVACGSSAFAHRPFDGTDAAVAEPGLVEIELGPAQYQQVGHNRTLFAPNIIFNYGLADRWELVLQGSLARACARRLGCCPDWQRVAPQERVAR